MKPSPQALAAIRTVALGLKDLRANVVFVGGAIRGFLVTDLAVEGSRPTKDVDVIATGIATRADYYKKIHARLKELGFTEDTSDDAPLCRWNLEDISIDVMPQVESVLGFANRWYVHAVNTANAYVLPHENDAEEPVTIRLVTAPSFLATKLEAFASRGKGDYSASHDVEDIVAIADGRSSLVQEVEQEPYELREYIARELSRHLEQGLAEAVSGHLAGDDASQARRPWVMCVLDRLARLPRIFAAGDIVRSTKAGQPGANGPLDMGPWQYEILGWERRQASAARVHVIIRARVANLGPAAGIVGDGRDVRIEDSYGRLFSPLNKLLIPELQARGLLGPYDQVLPNEAFETCWPYELPSDARALRLLLPFDRYELSLIQ